MIRSVGRAATQVGALQMRGNVSSSSTTTVVGQVGSAVDRAWWARSRYSDDQRGRREAVKPVEQDLAVRCAPNEPAGFIPRRPSPRTRSSLAPGVHLISKPRTPPGDSAGAYLNNSRSRNRTISQRLHPRDDPPPHRTGHRTHSPEATGPVARVHVPPPATAGIRQLPHSHRPPRTPGGLRVSPTCPIGHRDNSPSASTAARESMPGPPPASRERRTLSAAAVGDVVPRIPDGQRPGATSQNAASLTARTG